MSERGGNLTSVVEDVELADDQETLDKWWELTDARQKDLAEELQRARLIYSSARIGLGKGGNIAIVYDRREQWRVGPFAPEKQSTPESPGIRGGDGGRNVSGGQMVRSLKPVERAKPGPSGGGVRTPPQPPPLSDEDLAWLDGTRGLGEANGKRKEKDKGQSRQLGAVDKLEIARKRMKLPKGVTWVDFLPEGQIRFWEEYKRIRDELVSEGYLKKGERLTTRFDEFSDSKTGVMSVVVVKEGRSEKIIERISKVELMGKGIGLKIQDVMKGRRMRRGWDCGCVEKVNDKGVSFLEVECSPIGGGCSLKNYYGKKAMAGEPIEYELTFSLTVED